MMQTEERWTVPLAAVDRDSLALVGGKGANLGELIKAGFAVPPGFCVTTAAYARFVAANGLAPLVDAALRGLDVESPADLARAGATIRDAFHHAPVPEAIAGDIAAALRALGESDHLAVRSSATAEDLPSASFAGQQDTYLNVVGERALLDAVRRCWASLWTDRAIAYRARNGIPHAQVQLACVVQRMVEAEAAGVLFTANPLTGKRTEVVVDASPGLGEAIVSGLVSPDHYVVRKPGAGGKSAAIVERRLGEKTVAVRSAAGGGTERVAVAAAERSAPTLDDEAVLALARLGAAIEAHYGSPQDVEWARAGGAFFVLQARPITSLFPLPPAAPEGELRVFLSLSAAQGMLEPITPLGVSLIQEGFGRVQNALSPRPDRTGSPLVHLAGRLFADVTTPLRTEIGRQLLAGALGNVDPVARDALRSLFDDPRLAPRPGTGRPLLLRGLCRVLRASWPAPLRVVSSLVRPSSVGRRLERQAIPALRSIAEEAVRPGAPAERVERIRQVVPRAGRVLVGHFLPTVVAGIASWQLTERLVRRWRLDPAPVMAIRQGVPHNPTTEMDLDLWAVARRVRDDPAAERLFLAEPPEVLAERYRAGTLPEPAQSALAGFLASYGHRTIREIDVGVPRWEEDPTYLFGVIRGYLAHDPGALAPDAQFARLGAEAARAAKQLVAQVRAQRLGVVKAAVLRALVARMRALLGYREAPKFNVIRLLQAIRRAFQGVGADLAAAGTLESADDVFYLTLPELAALAGGAPGDWRRLVAERRRAYRDEFDRRRLPRVVTSEGETLYGRPARTEGAALEGVGVSPGVARGRVRVVRDPTTARLAAGEILVAPSTDPAWTPLFLTAAGLVMEAGGMMSHGAVVAREYGIPAVVGVAEATERLRTGQVATVDGSTGLVSVEEGPASGA